MMTNHPSPIRVGITGSAGQIAYSLLFRIASGAMFGPRQPVILQLLEIESAMKTLEGVAMELDDSAFPLLKDIVLTSNPDRAFAGVHWALLLGGVPRKAGMERSDLLEINGKIFVEQGQSIQRTAADEVRTLVVANPCNTNCLIAMKNASDIPSSQWFAMTRLDENRAKSQLAKKAKVALSELSRLAIWGNHSATQYPDFTNAQIGGCPVTSVIEDRAWLENDFIKIIQQRGASIIRARGASSAASAASAVIDTVASIVNPTLRGDWHSVGIASRGDYGIEEGLISSFPVRSHGNELAVVESLTLDAFSQNRIDATIRELKEERAMVADLLPHL